MDPKKLQTKFNMGIGIKNSEFYAILESDKKVTNNLFEINLPQKSLKVAVFCK